MHGHCSAIVPSLFVIPTGIVNTFLVTVGAEGYSKQDISGYGTGRDVRAITRTMKRHQN